ncbi:Protein kinase-like domain [Phytophthora cactorum]|nr:Protein kinase-like domain [Phytophthora cactorum]
MNEKMPMIPKWFIPRDAVEFDDETYFERGTWGENGLGTEVVVKCLVADNDKAQEEFRRESTVWYGLDHPNVVKMYGACHEGMPIFFVCEYVKERQDSSLEIILLSCPWAPILARQNIVHGDLKCNNILVEPTKDGKKAKICDFGFSYVRDRSQMSAKAKTQTIRWQAPEVLMPFDQEEHDHEYNPRFASDVYSFGMCISRRS